MFLCLLFSFLLVDERVVAARKFFTALAWVLFVFSETLAWFPVKERWRNLVRILMVLLLAPTGVTFILGGSDSAMIEFASVFAESRITEHQAVSSVLKTMQEGIKLKDVFLSLWRFESLEFSFKYLYLILLGSVIIAVQRFFMTFGRRFFISLFFAVIAGLACWILYPMPIHYFAVGLSIVLASVLWTVYEVKKNWSSSEVMLETA